jgi:hypothetical protein
VYLYCFAAHRDLSLGSRFDLGPPPRRIRSSFSLSLLLLLSLLLFTPIFGFSDDDSMAASGVSGIGIANLPNQVCTPEVAARFQAN